jgi:hypothetical protein
MGLLRRVWALVTHSSMGESDSQECGQYADSNTIKEESPPPMPPREVSEAPPEGASMHCCMNWHDPVLCCLQCFEREHHFHRGILVQFCKHLMWCFDIKTAIISCPEDSVAYYVTQSRCTLMCLSTLYFA